MTAGDAPNALVAGRYRLVRRLRTDDVGAVWEATDERLSRPVALTMLATPSGSTEDHGLVVARTMQAARQAAAVEHPNAVGVYDVFEHNGEPCVVTELESTPTLADRAGEEGTLTDREVAAVGAQVASALAAVRAAGTVHGDVTPSHIHIGEGGTARIAGLGVGHAGTPAHRAPEVADGAEPGYASDVFSLGSSLAAARRGARAAVPGAAPTDDDGLTPLVSQMLAPDPGRPSMAAVADQLSRVAARDGGSVPPSAAPVAPLPGAGSGSGGRGRLAVVVAFVVAAALVVGAIVVFGQRGGSDPSSAAQPQASSAATSLSPSPSSSTSASTTPASATASPAGPPSADQLAAVVTRYYSLVPGNPDQAFGLLTADYQTRVAGGRQAFQRFWAEYSGVTATDVTGSPPSTVTAAITYTTTKGQVTRERTTFGLVDEGGVLKIGSSTVTNRS